MATTSVQSVGVTTNLQIWSIIRCDMPELPEVETTRRGIRGALVGRAITAFVLREPRLRWRVESGLERELAAQRVVDVRRRAKYLLIDLDRGTLIAHLGMSGSLRIMPATAPHLAHDHYDIVLETGQCLRFNDPRRFGSLHWCTGDVALHPLLASLGPEPLEPAFDAGYLAARARGRTGGGEDLPDGPAGRRRRGQYLCKRGAVPGRASGRVAAPGASAARNGSGS